MEKKSKPVQIEGKIGNKKVFQTPMTALNDDWIRSARLKKLADQGDQAAKKELERLDKSQMMIYKPKS